MIHQGITTLPWAFAARDAIRARNGEDSHIYERTERVVELTQWIEKIEIVFRISNCSVENQIKFSTCTLLGNALTWWNFQVRTVGNDVAYAMTWTKLKKKMTDKYCLRTKIEKLESACRFESERVPIDMVQPTRLLKSTEEQKKARMINQQQQQHKQRGEHRQGCTLQDWSPANTNASNNQKGTGADQKPTCYESRGMVYALGGGETDQDPNSIEDEIET
ncbi:hypothetical protein Tco_1514651 [Tanacetum coccineum]